MTDTHVPVEPGRARYEVSPSRRVVLYLAVVGVLTLGVTVLFLFKGGALSGPWKLAFAAWFLASLGGLGGVLEGRPWARWVEAARLAVVPLALALA